jgi:hypothetical protein
MPPTSDDVYSVFLADLSEKERDRVRRYADNFGIDPTDAVWALMIVLGQYSDLYEAVPGKINVTVQGILEKIQSVAEAFAPGSSKSNEEVAQLIFGDIFVDEDAD